AADGMRARSVTGVQTCALPICAGVEASGVACRTFRHTIVVLSELLRSYGYTPATLPARIARRAAGVNAELLDSAADWLPGIADKSGRASCRERPQDGGDARDHE